jgi:hypothetical protein
MCQADHYAGGDGQSVGKVKPAGLHAALRRRVQAEMPQRPAQGVAQGRAQLAPPEAPQRRP